MPSVVFLDASARTQDLLNVKWVLRSAGHSISSTWHDERNQQTRSPQRHLSKREFEQLQSSDVLLVVCANMEDVSADVGMMAGFAMARGLKMVWIGPGVDTVSPLQSVRHFDTVDMLRRHLLSQPELN